MSDRNYVEIAARITKAGTVGAALIVPLNLAQVWGDWPAFAIVVAVQLACLAFNSWVTRALLRRGIRLGEVVRSVVNAAGFTTIAVVGHFGISFWLWVPYAAMTWAHIRPRAAGFILIGYAVAITALGLADGVPAIVPATFDGFALVCLLGAKIRFTIIRDAMRRRDAERQQLEVANAELATAHRRLVDEVRVREQIEVELRQAQKLEAIGRLAAGIAHEINTPVQFVSDSVHFVDDAARDLLALAARSRMTLQALVEGAPIPEVMAALARAEEAADLPYVTEQLPMAIGRVVDGLERITTIVRSMKEFAHPDQRELVAADLNRALLATITVAAHEYKLVADVDFVPGDLPGVLCRPGEINQVFLNLIVNAAHAIGDVVKDSGQRGRIAIATRVEGADAVITIDDTGGGIPAEIRDRIFDPFFTTKEVGRGTGQGLAIARNVIRRHGGALGFESEVGRGTTFTVRLPLAAAEAAISRRSSESRPPTPAG